MSYLMIENKGIVDPESITTLGVSGSRGKSDMIGMFGSGFKHGINTCVRKGLHVYVTTGNLHMDVSTKDIIVSGKAFKKLAVQFSGKDHSGASCNRSKELDMVTDWGATDWTDLSMALREFISNAIDGANANSGSHKDVKFTFIDKPRAKADHTRVFVEVKNDLPEAFNKIRKNFLHFEHEDWLGRKFLPKTDSIHLLSYKKGVLVNTHKGQSFWDYNFGDELRLDESRNAEYYSVSDAAQRVWKAAKPSEITEFLQKVAKDTQEEFFESKLSFWWYGGDIDKKNKENWKKAFEALYGENAVAGSMQLIGDYVRGKGFNYVILPKNIVKSLAECGVKTEKCVLDEMEIKGRRVFDATPAMIEAVDKVWALVEKHNKQNGRIKPAVKGFEEPVNAGSQVNGEYLNGIVYLHQNLSGFDLLVAALEEITHHITGAADLSRDIQFFLFRWIVELAL